MSISDPLADMCTQIINGQKVGKKEVIIPGSNLKFAVSQVLKEEGYILDCKRSHVGSKTQVIIELKYFKGVPVISSLKRVSKPGRRIYRNKEEIPRVLGGLGISIISTPSGVMTDQQAREKGHGGEVLCLVS